MAEGTVEVGSAAGRRGFLGLELRERRGGRLEVDFEVGAGLLARRLLKGFTGGFEEGVGDATVGTLLDADGEGDIVGEDDGTLEDDVAQAEGVALEEVAVELADELYIEGAREDDHVMEGVVGEIGKRGEADAVFGQPSGGGIRGR